VQQALFSAKQGRIEVGFFSFLIFYFLISVSWYLLL